MVRDADNVAVFTVAPEAGPQEILEASLSFLRAPTRLALWDLRRSTLNKATSAELRQATAEFLRVALAQRQSGRVALVVGNEATYGLMRMLITHAELGGYAVKLRAFRDVVVARAWLLDDAE
jgi:hypothetical protein